MGPDSIMQIKKSINMQSLVAELTFLMTRDSDFGRASEEQKNTRRKEEERPRTGTFFAPWGCMSVMQWPIFTGHFEALRLLQN